ncbi:hypothetical protein MC7420_4282 [Coleofasciculus chthonoplastes PCC 7420]|uniref:Uncharacterized protein n=1 Tax=Coleofasciculus chthonoplastes PCC 7420 TaxID=118168 RepID=B4W3X2_9CYAN|nr:hypothetical protein MC7420_4282 [Coleofasciculus chthonoplastes PCC 7420]
MERPLDDFNGKKSDGSLRLGSGFISSGVSRNQKKSVFRPLSFVIRSLCVEECLHSIGAGLVTSG